MSPSISSNITDVEPTSGRSTPARLRRRTARVLVVAIVLALTGTGLQSIAERRDAAAHPAPGDLVVLDDGRRMHLEVRGRHHEGPVVVLETGMGGTSSAWAWVQPALAEHATVVAYDRAGLGWSDPSPDGPAAEHVVADLRQALPLAGLAGRGYVLVGHSLGAHYVRAFEQAHPDEVAGMVLVDPSHERQAENIPGYGADTERGKLMMRVLHATSRLGINRLYDPFGAVVADLPEPQRSRVLTQQVTPGYFAAYRAEFAAMDGIGATLAAGDTDLGDLPLAVLMAGHSPSETGEEAVDAATRLREELVGLSRRGEGRHLPDADHLSIVTDPRHAAAVTDAVLDVLRS